MGRIGRWINAKIDAYITGVIESRFDYNISARLYGPAGDDSPPLDDDRIALMKIDGSGKWVAVGVLVKSDNAEPGEKKLYSRDANGNVKAEIYLKKDGVMELNGNADFAVSHTDLNTALQVLVTAINANFATKLDGGGATGILTLDISGAKVAGVKLP